MFKDLEMKRLREMMQAMVRYDLTSVKISDQEQTLHLERSKAPSAPAFPTNYEALFQEKAPKSLPETIKEPEKVQESEDSGLVAIESPMVGTYYASSKPGAAPYVAQGQRIEKGQVIGIIEAMKVMNEVKSSASGVVEELLVQDRSVVEYGTVLMRLRP